MKITICQLNPIVGDIKGNIGKLAASLVKFGEKTDLVVFPELFLTGYPPRDLLEKEAFVHESQDAINELIKISKAYPNTGILVGMPVLNWQKKSKVLYNSAILIFKEKILGLAHKSLLPSYDVFDETRYFESASQVKVIPFKTEKLGVSICEDMWNEPGIWSVKTYQADPIERLAKEGATLFINISASPFYAGKDQTRYQLIQNHAKKYGIPFIYVNQVGGNDELIFDGKSICVDKNGEAVSVFPPFKEHIGTIDTSTQGKQLLYKPLDKIQSVHGALILGIQDYMRKCGFSKAVIGLSGGIDSAVTCSLAKEALGAGSVLGISMPSIYSSKESEDYSRKLTKNLGVQFKVLSIAEIYNSYLETLGKELDIKKDEVDITLQNVQARIRGNILMAFSNKFGYLLLTTGNKSEMAVGYCTMYGDMAGGLAVISDVPKTMVYELARFINRDKEIIPTWIIDRAPTAELKPGQFDQDTLPPYDILDKILYYYLEEGLSSKRIIEMGFNSETVRWVVEAVRKNEYKRRQAPPGLKVTTKAFGMGRRMPIAARYNI